MKQNYEKALSIPSTVISAALYSNRIRSKWLLCWHKLFAGDFGSLSSRYLFLRLLFCTLPLCLAGLYGLDYPTQLAKARQTATQLNQLAKSLFERPTNEHSIVYILELHSIAIIRSRQVAWGVSASVVPLVPSFCHGNVRNNTLFSRLHGRQCSLECYESYKHVSLCNRHSSNRNSRILDISLLPSHRLNCVFSPMGVLA